MAWGAAAMMIGQMAGDMFGQSASTRQQYKYQSRLQQQQQAWLESMANTAHQREVKDLRSAGLNPILSATGGNGAATPQSGMGQINAPDYGASVQGAVSSALQLKRLNSETKLIDEQAKTEQQRRDNFTADSDLKRMHAIGQQIENKNLPEKFKREFKKMEAETYAAYGMSSAAQVQAAAASKNATTNQMNAQTQKEFKEIEGKLVGKKLGWYDIENIAKGIGMTAGAMLSLYGLRRLPNGKIIKDVGNLIKVIPKTIKY